MISKKKYKGILSDELYEYTLLVDALDNQVKISVDPQESAALKKASEIVQARLIGVMNNDIKNTNKTLRKIRIRRVK